MQTSRAEMPDPIPESSGRNPQGYGVGASNDSARKRYSCQRTDKLMETVVGRENMLSAYKRVVRNKGASGSDGMTVDELKPFLQMHWAQVKEQLLKDRYKPQPVLRIEIPKPGGKGVRKLGIPTVLDRLIQQAVLQVLTPIYDPCFSKFSYGFRPGRSAHQALCQAREHMAEGKRWVVDMDLEKFFDEVHHDILMSRIAMKIADKRILRLIRSYLQAGIMTGGLVTQPVKGTPQGGPLSPLLSNILLDDLDNELEQRGHRFCRYADDCNIYVGSRRAGERLLSSLDKFVTNKLRLKINRSKSAVDRPWNRKFLGYSVTYHNPPRLKVALDSVARFKGKVKEAFRRGRGRNLKKFIMELQPMLRGWINYFRLSEVKGIFEELDEWIRHHLRCVLWRQWKRNYTRMRQMRKNGISEKRAWKSATNGRGPWWNSRASHMNQAFPKKVFDRLGLVSLLDTILTFNNNLRTAVYGTVRTVV
ncbi:MAG: group II intron reverse transcriptase/maturase [Proteobacteria bacterium]|nr:group II intron reverse transcriptase/maturase [Pseudomonadota bacterium]MBU1386997.1 group II intron reverse transcriptase/maturase [Pseudomonadota bacterium]MBU1542322.1 group II intron reverse transcriptase/maturase [Pseudomonadota bacterium]MBU2481785.1 group II intron reverse transcriptase/maturase [Pseudomonadota bacterium]